MLRQLLRIFPAVLMAGLSAASLSAADVRLVCDKAHSDLEFDVKATMHSFTGKVSDYSAELAADPQAGTVTKARIQFNFTAAQTGDKKRDHEMLEWEDSAKFPEVLFVLSAFEPLSDGKYTATGQLTFHGVTKVIRFPVGMSVADGKTYSFDGDTDLDVRDYGLPVIRKFGMLKVQPVVKVRFHLQASIAGN